MSVIYNTSEGNTAAFAYAENADAENRTDRAYTSVKGNNKLSFKEADTLIEQLLQAKNPYTCPHGRPTIISLSKYELEKKFKRIQS